MSNPAFTDIVIKGEERRERRSLYEKMKRLQDRKKPLVENGFYYPTRSLTCYFETEGDDWDVYLTNDAEGRYFSARYVVDMEPDTEYFDTIEEVCLHVAPYIGRTATNKTELLHAIDEWEAENEDPEKYVLLKEIEVVGESDYW